MFSQGSRFLTALGIKAPKLVSETNKKHVIRDKPDDNFEKSSVLSFTPSENKFLNQQWQETHSGLTKESGLLVTYSSSSSSLSQDQTNEKVNVWLNGQNYSNFNKQNQIEEELSIVSLPLSADEIKQNKNVKLLNHSSSKPNETSPVERPSNFAGVNQKKRFSTRAVTSSNKRIQIDEEVSTVSLPEKETRPLSADKIKQSKNVKLLNDSIPKPNETFPEHGPSNFNQKERFSPHADSTVTRSNNRIQIEKEVSTVSLPVKETRPLSADEIKQNKNVKLLNHSSSKPNETSPVERPSNFAAVNQKKRFSTHAGTTVTSSNKRIQIEEEVSTVSLPEKETRPLSADKIKQSKNVKLLNDSIPKPNETFPEHRPSNFNQKERFSPRADSTVTRSNNRIQIEEEVSTVSLPEKETRPLSADEIKPTKNVKLLNDSIPKPNETFPEHRPSNFNQKERFSPRADSTVTSSNKRIQIEEEVSTVSLPEKETRPLSADKIKLSKNVKLLNDSIPKPNETLPEHRPSNFNQKERFSPRADSTVTRTNNRIQIEEEDSTVSLAVKETRPLSADEVKKNKNVKLLYHSSSKLNETSPVERPSNFAGVNQKKRFSTRADAIVAGLERSILSEEATYTVNGTSPIYAEQVELCQNAKQKERSPNLNRTNLVEKPSTFNGRNQDKRTAANADDLKEIQDYFEAEENTIYHTPEEFQPIKVNAPIRTKDIVTDETSSQVKASTQSERNDKVKKILFPGEAENSLEVCTTLLSEEGILYLTPDQFQEELSQLGCMILPLDGPIQPEDFVVEEVIDQSALPAENQPIPLGEDILPETETEVMPGNQIQKRKRHTEPAVKTPPKKRKVEPAKWKSAKAKLAHASGIAHISLRGKEKKARALREPCKANCRQDCRSRINQELREELLKKYWGLKDKVSQWMYLSKLVRIVDIKRRKAVVEDEDDPFRKHSYEYYLCDPREKVPDFIKVCQTMFLSTFDISISIVKTALLKNSPDKRGKHAQNRKRISPILIDSVKEHVKKFPLIPSHYCRADSRKKYLDENLSVAKMYRLYLMSREEDDVHVATERQYRDIFNTCFNLGFFHPKKDQCSLCIQWADASPNVERTQQQIQEYNQHHHDKKRVRELKQFDKELSRDIEASNSTGSKIRMVTFDLQKVLYCPKAENAELYYRRKLSCFNFTIYDGTAKQAYNYVWDETTGKKGSDEVTSFVLDYIESMVKIGINDFRFYSDSCTGQNKNQFLFSMYYMAVVKFNVKITHRWLVKGHTQMECDSVHARIEKKIRNIPIYCPSQYYGHMRAAKVKKPSYIVKEASQASIFSFRDLAGFFNWPKVPVSKLRELSIDSKHPGSVFYRTEFDGPVTTFEILSKKRGRPPNFSTYKLKQCYTGKLPIKPKLLVDLKWYVAKGLIPDVHLDFYHSLFAPAPRQGEGGVDAEEEEQDEDDVPQEIIPDGDLNDVLNELENREEHTEQEADADNQEGNVGGDESTDSEFEVND